eukprot:TRINITY_DN120890_c0_g1_i1.p1 TRINITY_DN120890_c0_g1~~TRINITY_DN120890_c0_g1_i1.p1  ORF type:complete len:241 (+),score=53.15 TRINITY_DN120890_c0_g1_i1:165-887(+)
MSLGKAVLLQACAVAIHVCVGVSMMRVRDFNQEIGQYGSYHQDWRNQVIHFIFVPTIWCCLLAMHSYVPLFGLDMTIPGTNHKVTWALTQLLFYVVYYLYLDPMGGGLFSIVLLAMYAIITPAVQAEWSAQTKKEGAAAKPAAAGKKSGWKVWQIAHIVHAFAWYMQIHPGHAVFEGVKPALVDSLGQALSVAPLFAFYEGVWAMGFAPELHSNVTSIVAAQRQQMCIDSPQLFSFCKLM